MSRTVAIVPHTHWDREWYASFQTFRLQLVDLLDELLPVLEADPSYAHFQLDGQMAVVDDYLAIRPQAADRLRRLATSGRLSMGPWYALPDEFLVSGETLVRNLQLGRARAASFGGAMPVGYLPDMFGHVAQMPQILRQFGLEHAVVWRGVPAAIDRDGFWWEAPDGSRVRAEYLPQGYGNGAHLPDDAKDLLGRVEQFVADQGDLLTGPILWMNGTDHLVPQPWLGRVVAEANDLQDDYHLDVTSLAAYLDTASIDGLPSWTGELRSGARANLLMGVASNRVDVKQAASAVERELERLAEPLSALFLPPERWPDALLDEAWRDVIRNSAHDSVCACSIDEVCDAVLHRYTEALRIGEGLTERALRHLAASIREPGALVVNPTARTRSGLVELRLPGEGEEAGMQLVSQRPTEMQTAATRDEAVQIVTGALDHQGGFVDADVRIADDGALEVLLQRDTSRDDRIASGPVLERMREVNDAHPGALARVIIRRPPVRRMLARLDDVPGFGWTTWNAGPLTVDPVTVDEHGVLDNGRVRVEIDRRHASFSVDGHAGFGRLVDDGDSGDTYNYNPPRDDAVVDLPDRVEVHVLERGPLRGRVAIDATYTWPERVVDERRVGERTVDVRTELELDAGDELVRVSVRFDNPCRDHRLRAWFPLPQPTDRSRAECAFAVVERGIEAEGGPSERGLPTFPSRRFVQAGGLTVVHDGLLEYELVDVSGGQARALALTLLRCTGMLSQGPMAYRPLPAGPTTPMDGPQMIGPQHLRYAVHVGDADPYALVDDAFVPLRTVDAPGTGTLPAEGRAVAIDGAEVSAVVREGGALSVRVFNPTSTTTTVTIDGRSGWLVDLAGQPIAAFEGQFDLAPGAIATARLT
jgi:hypothetical protein